jgi:cellulose synthase/poly-beta-1,6-N-acetylglucosamine synthase-like glycosyltransferase
MPPLTRVAGPRAARRARPALAPASRPAQAVVLVALALGLVYAVWRWAFTLEGAAIWAGAPLAAAETYGLIMLALLAFSCWRVSARTPAAPLPGRSVAVLISTYDEDEDVLRPTVLGALAIRHDPQPEVWVLDDGGRPWVERMCENLGVVYLSRPAPRRDAKAGNLNHALRHVTAEFLVTLDADHVPRPELLKRMLGHLDDPRVALVQGPQAFYNRGFQHPRAHEDPLHNEQSIFFDAILPGKDRHDAAFWCGCPSVIRREALVSVGGVATDTVVEDAHTTLRLHAAGWRTVYHPEVMALGLAPEEVDAFVVQRGRWARGSLQMLRREFPPARRGLSWRQRVEYTASCLHFFEGVQRLIGLLVPPAVLLSGQAPISASPLLYAALFVPQLVLVPAASRALTRGRYRVLEAERYSVVRMETYLRALGALVGRRSQFTVTPKGARGRGSVARALRVPIALAALTAAGLGYQSVAQAMDLPGRLPAGAHVITVLWAFANIALIGWTVAWASSVQHRRRSHRFPVDVHAAYSRHEAAHASEPGRLEDLSRHGAALVVPQAHAPGDRLRLVLLLDDGPVELTGIVATVEETAAGGAWRLGVDFDLLGHGVADAIVRLCFRHPFGPECEVRPLDAPAAPARAARAPAQGLVAAAETAAAREDSEPPTP